MKVLCLMGPTASGKTDISLQLAQDFSGEIVSVDSAMVYKRMDIGTAKPSKEIRADIPHHLIDIIDAQHPYSVGRFLEDALSAIQSIQAKGKLPILVGGTMLYFKALQQGLSDLPTANYAVRQALMDEANLMGGWEKLHSRLTQIDPISAGRISPNDPQRIQRALEVYEITGKPISSFWGIPPQHPLSLDFINVIVAPRERKVLHDKIAHRFDIMLDKGFISEVEGLFYSGELHSELPSIRSVGYRQVWEYLEKKIDYSTMKDKGIIATRQLAKRQLTWLRHWEPATWFDNEDLAFYIKLKAFLEHVVSS